ncbi:MAG: DNA repair protein RecO [Coxiellaceae bacterium]|nr:DNA repair protein RecO [Coxiellaceae bacterium]
MQRIALQPTYILHTRPYRSTSLLVELLSQDYGRLTVVANSARGPKSRYKGVLQPFRCLLVDWSGARELKSLGKVELRGMPYRINGVRLFCGYYLNELLMRLLAKDDPYEKLFEVYQQTLQQLSDSDAILENTLRLFEKRLLQELGYGVSFTHDASHQQPIEAEQSYSLAADRGFYAVTGHVEHQHAVFSGANIVAIANDDYSNPQVQQDAKKIMRYLLRCHIGTKPLNSRELIKGML